MPCFFLLFFFCVSIWLISIDSTFSFLLISSPVVGKLNLMISLSDFYFLLISSTFCLIISSNFLLSTEFFSDFVTEFYSFNRAGIQWETTWGGQIDSLYKHLRLGTCCQFLQPISGWVLGQVGRTWVCLDFCCFFVVKWAGISYGTPHWYVYVVTSWLCSTGLLGLCLFLCIFFICVSD